jgi:16S rRNA (cytosine1402-N4)-methyltransferase
LLEKSVDYLITEPSGIYVDGTLGGGGHAANIIGRLSSGGKLYAFDKDEEAIAHCLSRFKEEIDKGDSSKIELVNQSFEKACSIKSLKGKANGLLLDLGVSSRQLDSREKGFSYRVNTSLDMRFGADGKTAEAILNSFSEQEIEKLLRDYGEEPFAKKIARRISEIRRVAPLRDTAQLRQIVEESVAPKIRLKSLSRVFQAIRIAVNGELDVLRRTIEGFIPMLAPGGRIVVISYHSLEDRIVKSLFREHTYKKIKELSREDPERAAKIQELKLVTKKPILPDYNEIEINVRARSAKLRIAEKV